MSLLTIVLILVAWLVFILLAGAFIHGAQLLRRRERDHWRSDGPVVLNPDVKETIHVRGTNDL